MWCCFSIRAKFFFSSRRRHTRWTGDWSSDVCSSDLLELDRAVDPGKDGGLLLGRQLALLDAPREELVDAREALRERRGRSEERRVGKECRSQCLAVH